MKTWLISIFICSSLLLLAAFSLPNTNYNIEREESLGEKLFFDKILSKDFSLSCASCHIPEFAFADTAALSLGVNGQIGTRNTPSCMNMSARETFFWDGRAQTLEEQALMPIENPIEMNLPIDSAIARLQAHELYPFLFYKVYGDSIITKEYLASALANFQRSLETLSDYDKFVNGNENAISAQAKRGLEIFNVKGKCLECHFASDLTGDEFRNIGLFDQEKYTDFGRFDFSKDSADMGKFKVPGLRNVAITAPYMHDGSFKTLREVIDYYDNPDAFVPKAINRDSILNMPLQLTEQEKDDLEAFLHTLTAPQFLNKN